MYKLVVLSILFTSVLARPGYLSGHYGAPVLVSAPVIGHLPSAVSHQSHVQIHHKEPILKSVIVPIEQHYVAPIVSSYVAPAPVINSYASPWGYAGGHNAWW